MGRLIKPNLPQKQALIKLDESIKKGDKKFLAVLPSGIGKTIYSAFAIKNQVGNILYLVHRKEILDQAMKEFAKVLKCDIKEFGLIDKNKKQFDKRYTFSTIQSLSRDKTLKSFKEGHFKFIILDEWHHVRAKTYERVLKHFKRYKLLGLTATPFRLDGKDVLKPANNNVIYDMGIAEGIKRGFLCSVKYLGFYDSIDYSDIKWQGYKYSEKDLNKKLLINRRDKQIIKEFKAKIKNKQTIGFCCSIKHVQRCVKKFSEEGIECDGITYKTTQDKRESIINAFNEGKLQIIFTRDIFNEGINFPQVEGLLFLRPTHSKTIFLQQLGRGLRKHPSKKEVIILDFIGNYVNAWKIRKWIKEIIPRGGKRPIKPTYKYNVPSVKFDKEIIKVFEDQIERNITKDKLIKEYYRVKKLLKRVPLYRDFCYKNKISKYSAKAYENYFGTWNLFLKSIGEKTFKEFKKMSPSPEELIKYYREIKKKLGRIPYQRDLKKYSYKKYLLYFECKSWNVFLKYIGDYKKITKQDFKKEYIKIRKSLGRPPTKDDWIKLSKKGFGIGSVTKRFGTLKNFIIYCGDVNYCEYKKQLIISDYKKCFKKLGRRPTVYEWDKITGRSYNCIYVNHRSWEDFCCKMEERLAELEEIEKTGGGKFSGF